MTGVTRLLTSVDINDADDDGPNAHRMSVTARQEAVLEDGRRVVLLDDRGWSGSTQAEMEAGHWETLARILRKKGAEVEAAELRQLPHDVELSTRLRVRARGDFS
jgi:hypothetical protein